MPEKIIVYTSDHCAPCKKVRKMIEQGDVVSDYPIELVSIDTEEGFERFNSEVEVKEGFSVPSAYKGAQRCDVLTDSKNPGKIIISCPQ